MMLPSAVERYAHDYLMSRNSLSDIPVDRLGSADRATEHISLVVSNLVPGASL
jgi:hypothetical protein